VKGKGIIKCIAGNYTSVTNIRITIDGQISEINGSNLYAQFGSSAGSNGISGVWAQVNGNSFNVVLNLPFTTGFSVELVGTNTSGNKLHGSTLWAIEV
jgi:hypothetical protein